MPTKPLSPHFQFGRLLSALIMATMMMVSIHGALASTGPFSVRISPANDRSKAVIVESGQLLLSEASAEPEIVAVRVEETTEGAILHLSPRNLPTRFLNIQDGTPLFSEIPRDWWSGQWVLKMEGPETGRLVSRWKQGLALGINSDGQIVALRRDHSGALWHITIGRSRGASAETSLEISSTKDSDSEGKATDTTNEVAPTMAGSSTAVHRPTQQKKPSKKTLQTFSGSGEPDVQAQNADQGRPQDKNSMERQRLLFAADLEKVVSTRLAISPLEELERDAALEGEEIETNVYRFTEKQGETRKILNIQNGVLEATTVDPQWWSGQWVAKEAANNAVILQNRWKSNMVLAYNEAGGVLVADLGKPGAGKNPNLNLYWYVATREALKTIRSARQQTAIVSQSRPPVMTPKPKKSKQREQEVLSVADQSTAPKQDKEQEAETTGPVEVAGKQSTPPTETSVLERIRGEIATNNNNTYAVGPWQAYTKLYSTDLFGAGETIWILGDFFQWGDEMQAVRGGMNLPLSKESPWNLRYTFHLSSLNPYPVDKDYQWLRIKEREHNIELYKVRSREGHRNETGMFLNFLDSDQEKLELNQTAPRDLGFSSRDVGLFTGGNFWSETETTKDSGNYYFSVSAGIDALNASKRIAAREEAMAFPVVVKGRASYQREWKTSRFYFKTSAAFNYADRVAEWHKHFALGGQGLVNGFPAAEAAGEIGAGISVELGRTLTTKAFGGSLGKGLLFTPYVRGDIGFTNSLYDDPTDPMDYMRDTMLASITGGIRFSVDKTRFDIGYGLPIAGESRFDNAEKGRFVFSATTSW